jgi:hypothetical protein
MMLNALLIWKAELAVGSQLALAGAAWRWGAGPERACVAANIYMRIADLIYHWLFGTHVYFANVEIGHAFIDLTTALAFLLIALRANRVYPLWLSALQFVSFISHIAVSLSHAIAGLAYWILIVSPSYLQLIVLALSIFLHHRRVKQHGTYRSWRTS